MPTELERLRKRAQWYREFAELGTRSERAWRLQMAIYFDRLADRIDPSRNVGQRKTEQGTQ